MENTIFENEILDVFSFMLIFLDCKGVLDLNDMVLKSPD